MSCGLNGRGTGGRGTGCTGSGDHVNATWGAALELESWSWAGAGVLDRWPVAGVYRVCRGALLSSTATASTLSGKISGLPGGDFLCLCHRRRQTTF